MSDQFTSLDEALSISPKTGGEMVVLVRRIIRDWVNARLPYPTDDLDVLIGIESQSDHLLGSKVKRVFGSSPVAIDADKEDEELADLYQFFFDRYETTRRLLIQNLRRERS